MDERIGAFISRRERLNESIKLFMASIRHSLIADMTTMLEHVLMENPSSS